MSEDLVNWETLKDDVDNLRVEGEEMKAALGHLDFERTDMQDMVTKRDAMITKNAVMITKLTDIVVLLALRELQRELVI